MKPYYEEDGITIYHGDCLDVLPSVTGVDLIVTSPPYNIAGNGVGHYKDGGGLWNKAQRAGGLAEGYDGHADAMPTPRYEEWQREVLAACWAALGPAGAIFYNHKPRVRGTEWWSPLSLNPGLPVRQVIIWDRNHSLNFNPTSYAPRHEWIILMAKEAWRLRDQGASGVGDVWAMEPEHGSPHPAPFPKQLPARAIETTAPALVLDPFMGSGTTLRAAKDAGISAVGIEISERYCEIAAKRLAQGVLNLA